MRTDYTQLPSVLELKGILEKEAKRDPAIGKENLHYPKFNSIEKWFDAIGEDSSLFSDVRSWEDVVVGGELVESRIVEKTLSLLSSESKDVSFINEVCSYLGEEDVLDSCELAFVFGSQSLSRIQKAVELWKAKKVERIFITGKGANYLQTDRPEAVVFKEYAISQGVPESIIIIEPESITIADNVRRSLNLFDQLGIKIQSMVIINTWFAMRRSWAFMNKYLDSNCKLERSCSAVTKGGNFDKNNWYKNETGLRVVFNEFVKMKIGVELNTC